MKVRFISVGDEFLQPLFFTSTVGIPDISVCVHTQNFDKLISSDSDHPNE
jgi:hypothetical protein